ncbi:MAG TPA: restriction endonuclease subunit S [bacterium]|nr:restriction endonuclease subunit S [bacterium]HQO92108.1 restriction endonuclease subunit S [bacterium]
MSEWKECKLGEVAQSANTGLDAIKRAPIVDKNTGIKCLRIQDVSQLKKFNDWGFTEVEKRNFDKFQLKKNDIFIARTGASVGVNIIIKNDLQSVFNNGLIRIRANEKICDAKYLYYNFRTPNYNCFIESISGGTSTQPNMQINVLLSYDILLPPLPEQKAIASVLSSLDDKIDLLHRQNKTLEAMAETLFRKWFLPAEASVQVGMDGKLGDVIDLVYGKGLKEEIRTGAGFPVVGSSGIVGYHSEYFVEGPGIVIGRKGTLGKVIYLWENFFPIDTTYFVKSKLNSKGLYYEYFLLKTLNFEDMNSDSAVPGLNRDIALLSEINIPPTESIKEFDIQCSNIFNKICANNNQIRTIEKLRDNLLPKLMSGEVRVLNLD